ncbi:MAG: helix-turn-helix domain-containing protein [Gammaproteobacteria bacterium]|nr:helix-turn-helix domain-containing protein [Gammaproteobacteria bacterium]
MTSSVAQLKRSCEQCALSCFCLARDLLGSERTRFASVVKRRRILKPGDNLFIAGDRFHALYILHTGAAKSYLISESGEQQVTGFHMPGELIGIDGLSDHVHAYCVEMLETSSVCELPMPELDRMIATSRALRHRFLSLIAKALIDEQQMLLTLGKLNAEQRLAQFLLNMSQRHATLGGSESEFNLSMSRYDIASYLGLVVETVSRMIRRFQEEGVIEVEKRWVHIIKEENLRQRLAEAAERSLAQANKKRVMSSSA